jgi:hypothetical protein
VTLLPLLAAALLAHASPARPSSAVPPPASDTMPGAELSVYLMTMGFGTLDVCDRFGHNAIRIRDEKNGTDVSYNWGVFSFDQPNFLLRFLTGDTKYWVAAWDTYQMIEHYRERNRSVWMQKLNVTPQQRVALRDFVEWNVREENKFYRYDYYRDNCSTRVRDALDRVLGGRIRAATANVRTGTTYRSHTRRLLDSEAFLYTGIMIALGEPADRELTAWDEMFLPVRMRERIRSVNVPDITGREVPLVAREMQIFLASTPPELLAPRSHLVRALSLGIGIALMTLVLAWVARNGGKARVVARRGLATLSVMWLSVAGIIGVILILAWTATRHVFWARNENLLLFLPIALLVAPLAPGALRAPRVRPVVGLLAGTIVVVAIGALLIQPSPGLDQVNGEVIALALPIDVAIAGLVWMASRDRSQTPGSAPRV